MARQTQVLPVGLQTYGPGHIAARVICHKVVLPPGPRGGAVQLPGLPWPFPPSF